MLSAVLMSETFGIGELKPDQTETKVQFLQRIDVLVNPLTAWMSKVTYLSTFTVCFDSIFEAAGHVVVVVSPLVNRIQDQVHKLANVGILPLLLVISVNKMQEVYGQGNG